MTATRRLLPIQPFLVAIVCLILQPNTTTTTASFVIPSASGSGAFFSPPNSNSRTTAGGAGGGQQQQNHHHHPSPPNQHHLPIILLRTSSWPVVLLHATPPRPTTTTPSGTTTTSTSTRTTNTNAKPRTGLAQSLLDMALSSPLWTYILVPQARSTIVQTAEKNGIPWFRAKSWLVHQMMMMMESNGGSSSSSIQKNKIKLTSWESSNEIEEDVLLAYPYPEYYKKAFHAYPKGNLCYDAALEQELASRAVGARNFPKYSSRGEDVFRGAFDEALSTLGAGIQLPLQIHEKKEEEEEEEEEQVIIVDFGCGTGTSTRRLAKQYPQATQLIGIDLSPYFIEVGQTLLRIAPSAIQMEDPDSSTSTNAKNAKVVNGGWITDIDSDDRIQLRQGDMATTHLPSNSVAVVNLSLVLHELPISASKQVIQEAYRILRPGGQLWISEMDFESPAYRAQRENALLFSLLRATEPYLDEYADGMPELREFIAELFDTVKIAAATGRHFALLAEKGNNNAASGGHAVLEDYRFKEDGSYAIADTHLKPWESKEESSLVDAST